MLKNKMKKLICGMTMCITVCSQMIFPQTAFAATKAAVEKAGEAFVAGMTETAEAEEVLSEEEIRQQIVDFALQFEGNPYVYGGTSLTNGADCSGFVMSVFAQFGYSLPRVAADQYNQSVKKSVEDLEPGDLVFYGSGISHVALYIGTGQIIHASTSASGIKISNYDYEAPVGVGTYIEADEAIESANAAAFDWISVELSEEVPELPPITDPDDMELEDEDVVRNIQVNIRLYDGWDE